MDEKGKFLVALFRIAAVVVSFFVLTVASCQVHHEVKQTELKKHLSDNGYSAIELKCLFSDAGYGGREACVMVSE